jgi:signal transduction histidine kinase/DNA-binding response OmpR family regulator
VAGLASVTPLFINDTDDESSPWVFLTFPMQHQQRSAGRGETQGWIVYSAIAVSFVGVLAADLYTPLGIAVWIVYLVPVLLSLMLWQPQVPVYMAVVTTLLMISSFLTDDAGVDRWIAQVNRGFGILTIWVMAVVGYFFIKNRLAVRYQQWIQEGRVGLGEAMSGERSMTDLGDSILKYLAERLDARVGALFMADGDHFRRIATYGVPQNVSLIENFRLGDGLLGQAAKDRRRYLLQDVPDGLLVLGSSLAQGKPRRLLIAPMQIDHTVHAVIELGFLDKIGPQVEEFLEEISDDVAVSIRSGSYRANLQRLLEQTQRQAEELEVQSEELRVVNEELEVQSRSLQESQARLEQQQVDLEQSNVQLEEQTQLLEAQRDDMARARAAIAAKAEELERASQFKSEFLANMSHELRTPLNSSLILAHLLAENPKGNLTDDQVRSAQTIVSAGNDLLTLINDILDLSKIEAGHMEVRREPILLNRVIADLGQTVRPLAEKKNLPLEIQISPNCPHKIETDRQRLEQILKNLLSNAIKFTEHGEVRLTVAPASNESVRFEVIDTGIGIAPEQQEVIFDAFRQADSAANRKFSGTGLGLSISRELAKLLGGEITLVSQVGQGSTFTLLLPHSTEARVAPHQVRAEAESRPEAATVTLVAPKSTPSPMANSTPIVQDDRDTIASDRRSLLIVEDDPRFARILYDQAHDLGFHCLVATTAEEALILAIQYLPNAIILDVRLPDQSGLSVLDRLKHDSRTRHIPVHMVSASDHAETARAMGAVGYMLKPVTREQLVEALMGLEHRLEQRLRRVLLVEDDPVQLDSLRQLIGSPDVETVGVGTAAECLAQLRSNTFDCMVLDLSLPDASGYSLLETLSQEDAYSFPPVIVYTGRDLSLDEEQKLRRYSRSIIIKGAKSPERLLDEVTLFLHQVVSELPSEQQRMIKRSRSREAALEDRRILVVEDDVRNIFALTSILEPHGARIHIARNGREAVEAVERSLAEGGESLDLVLMDVMMPEMDGLTATREIRKLHDAKKLPIIMLTAKAMKDDQENCFAAGANDYLAKPLDVDKLLSLVRVWIRK